MANALCDPDEKTRWAAVRMVADIGNAAATPEILDNLSTLLNDPMLEIREDAASAVGNLGSVAATEAILDRIAGLLKERHLNAAHEVLRGLKSAAATPDVLNCLAELLEDPDEFVQSYVAMIVAEMKDVVENPRIFDRLRILLIEGSAEVQENVLRAIGSVKNSESIEKLVIHLSEFLEDTTEDDFLRLAVLNAIKNIGKLAATPRILVCLGVLLDHATETNEIRRAAAGALGQFMAQGVRIFAGPDGKFVSKDVEVLSN